MVCHNEQTETAIKPLPVVKFNLQISPNKNTTMLVDTGAQVSLIKNNVIPNESLINTRKQIILKSMHGTEKTLGEITTSICKNQTNIPIQLHVTKNCAIKEDGILGFDIIGEKAIVDGPNKKLTFCSNNSKIEFPINSEENITRDTSNKFYDEIQRLNNIMYITANDENPQYQANIREVKAITRKINNHKIQISSNHYEHT